MTFEPTVLAERSRSLAQPGAASSSIQGCRLGPRSPANIGLPGNSHARSCFSFPAALAHLDRHTHGDFLKTLLDSAVDVPAAITTQRWWP